MKKEDADNRWQGIFASLGIDVGDGHHVECPICGKKNFRCDDKGKGFWICTCDNGDGWSLIQKILNCDFKSALDQVSPLIKGIVPGQQCKEKKISKEFLRSIFLGSKPIENDCLAGRYLKYRGLKIIPECLRYHHECYHSETKKNHDAMLAIVTLPDGRATTIHRTYLSPERGRLAGVEDQKKMMPCLEEDKGGVIRLFEPLDGIIAVAEGIETAIACYELHGIPTWSTVSASMMMSFEPPPGIKKVYIFGDNDSHRTYAGQAAAYTLAKRLIEVKKIAAEVFIPERAGDWLDELNRKNQRNA